jgi:hypothetical protein
MSTVEMSSCGMIILPRIRKFDKCVEAILRFLLSNLNGRNVGITDVKKL